MTRIAVRGDEDGLLPENDWWVQKCWPVICCTREGAGPESRVDVLDEDYGICVAR